ncbi:hypothetical protein J6590_033800 [Homalodisca vitripennis]|nr:hypothetical protein J6590_033800 [Homalodisca vitripennis]
MGIYISPITTLVFSLIQKRVSAVKRAISGLRRPRLVPLIPVESSMAVHARLFDSRKRISSPTGLSGLARTIIWTTSIDDTRTNQTTRDRNARYSQILLEQRMVLKETGLPGLARTIIWTTSIDDTVRELIKQRGIATQDILKSY